MINADEDDDMQMPVLHSFSPSIVNCMRNMTTELTLSSGTNLSEQAWNCLGCILSNNASVTKLDISLCDLDVAWLCAGLQYNQNIKEFRFYGVDLRGATKMNSLALFLSNNPSLREITLSNCRIGIDSIDIFANALMYRTADTLEYVDLDGNNLGDSDLDGLVTAVSTCKKLMCLYLSENGIGQRECTYLAQLLMSPESNLTHLYLCDNFINDEALGILTGSLSNNTKLRTLALYGNSKITRSGWRSLLKLVCDTSSMTAVKDSNHTLRCLGIYGDEMQAAVVSALGDDDAILLFASLELNKNCSSRRVSTSSIIRRKKIWGHARGGINIADSGIPFGAMPTILSWFGDYSNEENAKLIKYHDPPLPEEVVMTKRLNSLYRIIHDMPELCQSESKSDADVKKPKLCHDVEQISLVESEDTSELADSLARSQRGEFLIDTILRFCNVIALVLFSYSYMYGAQSGD